MKTIAITKVRKLKSHGLIIIDLGNGKPSIIRTNTQFLQDMKNSYLINESVMTIEHPEVLSALRDLKRGTVSGEISHHKEGEEWIVTEESRAITDPKHPQYGSVQVGDKLAYENDNTRVDDGFLDISYHPSIQAIKANATAIAQAQMAMLGAFDSYEEPTTVEASSDEIPDAVLAEVMSGSKEEEVPETVEDTKKKK